MIPSDVIEKLELWIDQASSEIILSDPGSDRSQFPLRDLLSSMTEKSTGLPELAGFHECALAALGLVEGLMFSGSVYSSQNLDALNELASQLFPLLRDPSLPFSPPPTLAAALTEFSAQPEMSPVQQPPLAGAPALPTEADDLAILDPGADSDLLKEFANEAAEHLENIEHGVLFLEDNPGDTDTIASIFRAFHTIKGGSGFLGITPINRLAHELESLLDLVRTGQLPVSRPIVELILEGADTFRNYVNELQSQLAGQSPFQPVLIPSAHLRAKVRAIVSPPAGTAPLAAVEAPAAAAAAAAPTSGPARSSGPVGGMIKVDIQKFDSLMDLVGELVIAQSLVAQDPGLSSTKSQNLLRNMSQMGMITNGLQKAAMSLRMVPIRSTFQKMNRLVRDTAVAKGKFVELVLRGEDTEMDRTIVEELADPLLHMVRNSVDHGIEQPEERAAAGKPQSGTIRLSASHVGGNILVEISDDGAGLRADAILAKAIERGMFPPGTSLPEKEIYELIFAPGFSTAATVTDLSGRGVGMDVVNRNISRLRGKIEIESSPGHGTSFKIYLPLTLAIIDGLMVAVGEQRYIIPTLSVRESFRPTPGMISTVHGKGEMVNVRGTLSPLLRLYDYFGIVPRTSDPCQSMVVVVESAHEARCILVDDLLGQQEVVIKSLGDSFKNNRMLSGAAILGDGRVGLILDPRALVQIRESQATMA
ncbi:MAG: chemotaxis protein CheW [Verrucomicrobiae bacterium]